MNEYRPQHNKAIQQQAERNAALYEAAFPWVLRNWSGEIDERTIQPIVASIIPTWDIEANAPAKST
jgi:very-short-patch-repair endonuclease